MIEVSSEQSRSQFICIQSAAAAAAAAAAALCVTIMCCCFLMLCVILCRMAKIVAGSSNLIPVFSFPFRSNAIYF